ncbi:MAG: TRAP transporter small permease [Desulfobacterota bacterium]|nr:TRAP transporter small permease [Thermodesulfobacteriota bacterium]
MSFLKIARRVERAVYPVVGAVHKVGLGLLIAMMLLTVVDVIGRKFFDSPITGSYELTEFMLALIVFFSVGYTQIQKGHIAMEALVSRFSSRAQALTDSIVYLISIGLGGLLTWQLVAHAKRTYLGKHETGVLHLPLYPFLLAAAFGCLLYSLVLLVDFLLSLEKARKP